MAIVRKCPVCSLEYPDTGQYLTNCPDPTCLWCRHASITSGVCDTCGVSSPSFFTVDSSRDAAYDDEA